MNKKCQIFTPDNICSYMLDIIKYKDNLYGKKVLENSCGDGRILTKIVKKYIENCIECKIEKNKIKIGLENDIYANEIDKEHIEKCKNFLNQISQEYGIYDVNWNIRQIDYLKDEFEIKFDYIIGNPPYITYRDLDKETREFVKNNFKSCKKGKFDYCYAFIEKSLSDLKLDGKFIYIVPSSILKNSFGNELRNILKKDLIKIVDFKNIKVFPNALISSVIIVSQNNSNSSTFEYIDYKENKKNMLLKEKLHEKWQFKCSNDIENVYRFGDFFSCSVSIATLLNRIFIISNYKEDGKYYYFDEFKIEKGITKNAISPRNLQYKKAEKIIFPYVYKNNKLIKMSEKFISNSYPCAYKYMLKNKDKLLERTSDKNSKWFEFGRSQALSHLNQKKLLCSTLVTNKMNVYKLSKNDIPYSGIYITPKNNEHLELALKIMQSEDFMKYVYEIGINASGNSIRITPKDIENFKFGKEEYDLWKN